MKDEATWGIDDLKTYGFMSNDNDFTMTYSEEVDSWEEKTRIMVLNGLMCGFPLCCVLYYIKRLTIKSKTGILIACQSGRTTETHQLYIMCPEDEHDCLYGSVESLSVIEEMYVKEKALNTHVMPLDIED